MGSTTCILYSAALCLQLLPVTESQQNPGKVNLTLPAQLLTLVQLFPQTKGLSTVKLVEQCATTIFILQGKKGRTLVPLLLYYTVMK